MIKRLTTSAVLAIALVAAPSGGWAQVSASLSLNMGLFDGFGMGLAVSNWGASSIYSPGFHVGFGASIGFGASSYAGSGYGYYDDYYYDDGYYYDDYGYGYGYDYRYSHDRYRYGYHRSYSPLYCRWWGPTNPCYGTWGPYGVGDGFFFSLGMAWNYYRRPVYFDPWWGSVGYYARWRPAWAYDPGWYYYNDPYWATPGYPRVAYVVPSRGYIYTSAPHAGYRNVSYKERADRVAENPRQAKPRESAGVTGAGVPRQSPNGTGRTVAQPGTEGPRNSGAVRRGTPGTETAGSVPGTNRGDVGTPRVATPTTRTGSGTTRVDTPSTRGSTGTPRVATPSTRAGNGGARVATPGRGDATSGVGASRPSTPRATTPSVFNPRRPTDRVRSEAGAGRTPTARAPSGTPSTRSVPSRTPTARAPSGTPSARSVPSRTPTARAPSGTPSTRSVPSRTPNVGSAPGRAPAARAPSRGGVTRSSPTVRAPSGGSRSVPRAAPPASAPNRSAPTVRSAPTRSAPTRTTPPKVRRPGGGGS